jgi:adenylate cyclase class IV
MPFSVFPTYKASGALKMFCRCHSKKKEIEVEAKFSFSDTQEREILSLGKLIGKKKMTDLYWDIVANYPLTTRDIWLRQRDFKWEIKIPMLDQKGNKVATVEQYEELTSEEDIYQYLKNKSFFITHTEQRGTSLEDILLRNNFSVIAKITTDRTTLSISNIHVDLDKVDGSNYRVGEIEVMVSSTNEIPQAEEQIKKLASNLGVQVGDGMMGKVLHYISTTSPVHWEKLVESGLIAMKLGKR